MGYVWLQQFRILGGMEKVHIKFSSWFGMKEGYNLLTLENCFKTQIIGELVLQTFPMMVIQSQFGNRIGYTGLTSFCLFLHVV
jgi:hypothetical protein